MSQNQVAELKSVDKIFQNVKFIKTNLTVSCGFWLRTTVLATNQVVLD
jgi:hypothetical protein